MKPSRSKEDRQFDQIQRGLAARRLIEDDVVLAWFDAEHARVVQTMISAKPEDDAGRRAAALHLQALAQLKSHLTTEATLGRKQQEKAQANDKA